MVLHCEWKKKKGRSQIKVARSWFTAIQWGFLKPSLEAGPQLPPTPHFIITRSVRLLDRTWLGLDLQDLRRHFLRWGGVHSWSFSFNLPKKKKVSGPYIDFTSQGLWGLGKKKKKKEGNYLCLLKMANKWPPWLDSQAPEALALGSCIHVKSMK